MCVCMGKLFVTASNKNDNMIIWLPFPQEEYGCVTITDRAFSNDTMCGCMYKRQNQCGCPHKTAELTADAPSRTIRNEICEYFFVGVLDTGSVIWMY